MFDKEMFFNSVRSSLFGGKLTELQAAGMEAVLDAWVDAPPSDDLRWLAYCFATDYHETSKEMQPIEEYGKGSGMEYGKTDPETGQAYYGRGYVQLTWRDNYAKATTKLGLPEKDDLVWYPENALDPYIAAAIMFRGMVEGWFRSGQTLPKYFGETSDDAYGAREIINGDKTKVPSWSNGVSIGNLIKGYHQKFLAALEVSYVEEIVVVEPDGPQPGPETLERPYVQVTVKCDQPINLVITCGANVRISQVTPLPGE